MSYWLHRISYHAEVSHPLLEQGYLSIGWSYFSTPDFIERTRVGDTEYFNSTIQTERGEDALGRSRWSLWKYLFEMHKGALVIVPGWKEFSIYSGGSCCEQAVSRRAVRQRL